MKDILELITEAQIMESIESSIVQSWMPQIKASWNRDLFFRLYQWDKVSDDDLTWYDQADAKKLAYKRNEIHTLFWIDNDDKLLALTNGNISWCLIDPYFARDTVRMKNIMPIVRAAKGAYLIDSKFSTKEMRAQRVKEKEGATALMKAEQIRDENIRRYEQILKEKRLSDGSTVAEVMSLLNEVTEKYKTIFDFVGNVGERNFDEKLNQVRKISESYSNLMTDFMHVSHDIQIENQFKENGFTKFYSSLKRDLDILNNEIKKFNTLFVN